MEPGLSIVSSWTRTDVGESATMSVMVLLKTSGLNKSSNLLKPHFPHLFNGTSPYLIVPVKAEQTHGIWQAWCPLSPEGVAA